MFLGVLLHDAIRVATPQLLLGSLVQVRREVLLDFLGHPPSPLRLCVDPTMIQEGRRTLAGTLADVVVADPF